MIQKSLRTIPTLKWICPFDACTIHDTEDILLFQSHPSAKIYIFPKKYEKPIRVKGFLDTGNFINHQTWRISSAKLGVMLQVIQCSKWRSFFYHRSHKQTNLLSTIPWMERQTPRIWFRATKEKISWWDFLNSLKGVSQNFNGLKNRNKTSAFNKISHFYQVDVLCLIRQENFKTSFIERDIACTHPFWTNPEFLITLPFKKNEVVNPIKANRKGVNPYLELTKKEINKLRREYSSHIKILHWHVKHSMSTDEQTDPRKNEIRVQLLKTGSLLSWWKFWWTFCFKSYLTPRFSQSLISIRDFANLEFLLKKGLRLYFVSLTTIGMFLPFGLKTAPSLFQKAMTRIFESIFSNA